ncbi:hypothetical protein TNCV_4562721 [Trichonephila clavipes]|uniref:Uncharacterized protein n=1 Tax=Trichonephila clavipes TaxID=2585209 RepID=A0A8X7BDZ9_TRICX|nr:hypothetical protein TNCV_4562721 [Trichonephila clavipes]
MLQDYDTSFSRVYFSRPRLFFVTLSLLSRSDLSLPCRFQILFSISSLVRPVARCRQLFLTVCKGGVAIYRKEVQSVSGTGNFRFFPTESTRQQQQQQHWSVRSKSLATAGLDDSLRRADLKLASLKRTWLDDYKWN